MYKRPFWHFQPEQELNSKPEADNLPFIPSIANAVLGDVLKVGNFIEFNGMSIKIFGCICRINNDNTIDYVRESLTRWNASAEMVQRGNIITEDDFINRVKRNAEISGAKIPSTEEVKAVLELYKSNFDVDFSEILSVLNIA